MLFKKNMMGIGVGLVRHGGLALGPCREPSRGRGWSREALPQRGAHPEDQKARRSVETPAGLAAGAGTVGDVEYEEWTSRWVNGSNYFRKCPWDRRGMLFHERATVEGPTGVWDLPGLGSAWEGQTLEMAPKHGSACNCNYAKRKLLCSCTCVTENTNEPSPIQIIALVYMKSIPAQISKS